MELARFPSHGGFSVRSIFTFVLAVIVTVLLGTILLSQQAHAADATWNGASLEYDGKSFYFGGTAKENQVPGIPADSRYYISSDKSNSGSASQALTKAYVIYLTPGVDPPGDGKASYALYDLNQATEKLSNPTNVQQITIKTDTYQAQTTTCAIDGIGWIICPVMNFLAWGMDFVFNMIAEFMEVQPLQVNNNEGALYNAWNIMRGVANIAFIIAFLIIIYAQLTSVQVNNYGLKRLLPRLIIAAIGINLSFIIGAVAVDLSNILGWSLHDVFTGLRNTLWNAGDGINQTQLVSWESITGFVLSGGTAALAGGIGVAAAIAATGGMATAAVFILLPALVGLLLTVLVVLLILAARQALIIILVIIAPLAIVAYLLPNTEKWFGKWRDLFMTMLIFFPAFSVVFGGSQLAGGVIIQNASSINMVILGMIVQVAPLVITPLLLKFSGNLLGGVARLVNNPNKGLIDRTRNWSNPRAKLAADRGRGGLDRKGNPIQRRYRFGERKGQLKTNKAGQPESLPYGLRRTARYMDQKNRLIKDRTANAETATQTAYENSNRYAKVNRNGVLKYDTSLQKATFEARKEATHSHHAATVDAARRTPGSMVYSAAMDAEAQKEHAEDSKNATAVYYNRARTDRAWANRVGAGALHTSSYTLEASKSRLESSESLKQAYYDDQRAAVGSVLNVAATRAYDSKKHLEIAQTQLQTYFDTRSHTDPIGQSLTVQVEQSKGAAERAKADLAAFVADERTVGRSLHNVTMELERAKSAQQVAEARVVRITEEYKGGGKLDPATGNILIDGTVVTPAQQAVITAMQADAARLDAERQGATSAQLVQRENIAKLMDENSIDPLTSALLRTAGSIDANGQTRAQANAISQLDKLEKEALSNSVTLLGSRAERSGMTIKALAKEMYAKQTGTFRDAAGNLMPQEEQDASMLEAAFEALAQDGDISTLRNARLDVNATHIDQNMLTRLFARHSSTMKAKGGFDLQADPSLAGASQERMDVSVAGSLGDVTAANIAGQKAGWWEEVAGSIDRIMDNVDSYTYDGDPEKNESEKQKRLAALRSTYQNVTMALTNPNVLKDIGDRLEPTIAIHQKLHARFNDPRMAVNYDLARKGQAPGRRES